MLNHLLAASLCLSSLAPAAPAEPALAAQTQDKVAWFQGDLEAALAEAKVKSKLAMAYFRADQIDACTQMSKTTFSDDRVVGALADVVCVRVDVHKQNFLAIRYTVKNTPAVIWFNTDGTSRDRIDDYKDPNAFLAEVARIKADLGTINEARRKSEAQPDDVDLHFELYRKLNSVGDWKGANDQKVAIIRLDPEGKSRARRHFKYEEITTQIEQHWHETGKLAMPKVEELQLFVEVETDPELVYDGWMRLANTHEYLGNQAASIGQNDQAMKNRATRRDFLARAYRALPASADMQHWWSFQYSDEFWNQRDELSAEDKDFLVKLTGRMVQAFDKEALAYDHRARALMLLGAKAEALDAAKKAVEIEPANKAYQDRLKQIQGG